MKIVQVSYTTSTEFSEQNQQSIKLVMEDLKKGNFSGISYKACLASDGKTFIHTALFKSENDQRILSELPAFQSFQKQLKASGLESPPKQEALTLVGSSKSIF